MIELIEKAEKAKKDIVIEMTIRPVNLSLPNMETQSSLQLAADDEADISKYAST